MNSRDKLQNKPKLIHRYSIAVLSITSIAVIKLWLGQYVNISDPFILFYAGVMLSAWYGGFGPGLVSGILASLLGYAAVKYNTSARMLSLWPLTIAFFFESLLITLLCFILRRSNERYKQTQNTLIESEKAYKFLAEANQILSSSLDYETTLTTVARLAIPEIADWCSVDIFDENNQITRIAVAHKDPAKLYLTEELAKYPQGREEDNGLVYVLKTGKAVCHTDISDALLQKSAKDENHLRIMREIGIRSMLIVPLIFKDKINGAISFIISDDRKKYSALDVSIAEQLGRHASLAIENSRAFTKAEIIIKKEQEQSALLKTILENSPVGIAFVDKNLNYVKIHGTEKPNEYLGKQIGTLNSDLSAKIKPLFKKVLATGKPVINVELNGALAVNSPQKSWLASYYPVKSEEDEVIGVGAVINDITELKEAEESMRFQAYNDQLTDLPNRKAFERELEKCVSESKKSGCTCAVLFIDLDRFKDINDTLGHEIGDLLLAEIAQRLKRSVDPTNFVARWGGDEFIILLSNISSSKDAAFSAKRILKTLRKPVIIDNYNLHISASIGISIYPFDGLDNNNLLKNADAALYRAKENRNQYQLYSQTMNLKTAERLILENNLRQAIKHNELSMVYQPIMNISSGEVIAMEALLRWHHPTLGLLFPAEFIHIAEETGSIIPLSQWVLRSVCKQIKTWQKEIANPPKITVNISGRQFSQANLVYNVAEILKETQVPSNSLQFEITETIAMENIERTASKLADLNKMGIQILIDDFGVGYSSLTYLKRFPIQRLKIDQSFVKNCMNDEHDAAIIKAIISMAHTLNLGVTAEGVEQESQLAFLAGLGADHIQGFLLSKPLRAEEVKPWLANEPVKSHKVISKYIQMFTA